MAANWTIFTLTLFPAFQEIYLGCCTIAAHNGILAILSLADDISAQNGLYACLEYILPPTSSVNHRAPNSCPLHAPAPAWSLTRAYALAPNPSLLVQRQCARYLGPA